MRLTRPPDCSIARASYDYWMHGHTSLMRNETEMFYFDTLPADISAAQITVIKGLTDSGAHFFALAYKSP